jgi:prepilin-type N-terminal cleavage/methylation domain-containing protein
LNRYLINEKAEHIATNDMSGSASSSGQRGFSLVEMLVSMALLVLLISLAFDQITQLQKKTAAESSRVDMSQAAREFVDQTVRDLHLAGYPSAAMFATTATPPINDVRVAAGLVSVSPTQLVFEGDVNNDGQVYSVNIVYVAQDPQDPNCPCIRRSAIPKAPGSPVTQPVPINYTETSHVMPPGTGNGQSGEDLFTYFDQNGNQITDVVDINTAPQTLTNIKTVKVNLTLANGVDATGNAIGTSLSSTVRLNQ